MKKKYVFGGLVGGIACAALGSFLTLGGIVYALGFSPENVQNIVRFVGIRKLIEARYVGDVDDTTLMDGAISGMVQSLGDPHSLYMGPQMYEQLMNQTEGSFGGIGIYMGFKDDKVTVISVMDGTPGQSAGLAAGDDTAEQVYFVALSDCNDDIRVFQIRLEEHTVTRTVADNAHNIIFGRHVPDGFRIHVYHCDIVVFF